MEKKKRGRKPKNNNECSTETIVEQSPKTIVESEKKKRGRKKKYEIENFEKIINRNYLNNFNHNIAYSDDEEILINEEGETSNIAFGNLNITISKTNDQRSNESYRYNIIEKAKMNCTDIQQNEYSSESESEMDMDTFLNKKEKPQTSTGTCAGNVITKRLKIFHTLKNVITDSTWPKKTNVCCWWCCHPFENTPCTLPVRYNEYTKRYTLTGIFCSWNCTRAYNMEKNDHRSNERSELITFLVKQLSSIKDSIFIKKAPPRQSLKMFGGNMNINEFRNSFSSINSYHLNLLNYVYIYPEINEYTSKR